MRLMRSAWSDTRPPRRSSVRSRRLTVVLIRAAPHTRAAPFTTKATDVASKFMSPPPCESKYVKLLHPHRMDVRPLYVKEVYDLGGRCDGWCVSRDARVAVANYLSVLGVYDTIRLDGWSHRVQA